MNPNQRWTTAAEALARYRSGRLSRRGTLRLLAGLGLTAGGLAAIGRGATGAARPAKVAGPHAGHAGVRAALVGQEEATPAVTPALGERPDGTRLWRVRVAGMDMENGIDTQAFFPRQITVNAGDAIFFEFPTPPGFHTVTFLSGQAVPPLFAPDETGGTPPAGSPPGQPKLVLNPAVAFAAGGTDYDGTGVLNSGLDVLRLPDEPPTVVTFTTPGRYEYQCIPHGVVMKGTVVVQEAGATPAEDQAAVDARGERERAALIEAGKAEAAKYAAATSTRRDDGTTLWEVAAGVGEGQARVFRFLPDALEIKAGDTVRWVNRSLTEPHTVTFLGDGAEQPEDILVEPETSGLPTIVQNPLTLFPQGERVYRGEGYFNSGFLGELNGQPLPGTRQYELTFDTPGQYPYYCVLHAGGPGDQHGMAGSITVA